MENYDFGLNCKTDGESIFGKQNIFFCSVNEDFDKWFPMISKDILDLENNVVIWYNHNNIINNQDDYNNLLGKMKLFVFVITRRFIKNYLHHGNTELEYARINKVPVIPVIVEDDILEDFNKYIGNLQSLERYKNRLYYSKKLEEYLNNAIYDDEYLERIRKAFDAYIFLSYRKKDRKYAEKLMKLIHQDELCQDIAIWYDEYLKPGENFNEAISTAIKKSNFFCLMITDSLLEDGNYVSEIEYPFAVNNNKEIIPVEVKKTDFSKLKKKYKNINYVISTENPEEFKAKLNQIIRKSLNTDKINDPNHIFLIGLAYLNGIDLEKDVERGISLIKKASDLGLDLALEKLVNIYKNGIGVTINYKESIKYQKKLNKKINDINGQIELLNLYVLNADYKNANNLGNSLLLTIKNNKLRLEIICLLADTYNHIGKYEEYINLSEMAYKLSSDLYSENDVEKHKLYLNYLSAKCCKFDSNEKIINLVQKKYFELEKQNEDANLLWLYSDRVALLYFYDSDYGKSRIWYEKACKISSALYGHNSIEALNSEFGLARVMILSGEDKNGIKLLEENIKIRNKFFDFNSPDVIEISDVIINNYISMAENCESEEEYKQALEYKKKAVDLSFKVYGESNENIIYNLSMLHRSYLYINDYKHSLEMAEKAYKASCQIYGLSDITTAIMSRSMAVALEKLGFNEEAIKYLKQCISFFNLNHTDSVVYTKALSEILNLYLKVGKINDALDLLEQQVSKSRLKDSKFEIEAKYYHLLNKDETAKQLLNEELEYYCKKYGNSYNYYSLALAYKELGEFQKAIELLNWSQEYFVSQHGSRSRRYDYLIADINKLV